MTEYESPAPQLAGSGPRSARITEPVTFQHFDPRSNSLTLIRLALAILVLVSHAWPVGEFGPDPGIAGSSLGGYGVAGFFALSGYLITASARRYGLGRFLWHRVLRIYPAFWATLVVVSLVLAPSSYVVQQGSLAGYSVRSSITYLVSNSTLIIRQYPIEGTLTGRDSVTDWNGSVWSLQFEFACYIGIGLLTLAGLHRRGVLVALGVVSLAWYTATRIDPGVTEGIFGSYYVSNAFLTGSLFLGGALAHTFRRHVPPSTAVAAASAAVAIVALSFGIAAPVILGFTFCIILLWLSMRVRQPQVMNSTDISYGVYLYAFPLSQLFWVLGLPRAGVLVYVLVTALTAVIAAWVSWTLLERRALRLKDWTPTRRRRT